MGDVFFTSDTHFGHQRMVEAGWRSRYSSVAEMDADLIERWNAVVRPGDTVWHLGDFGMGGAAHFLPIVAKLHGTIHLVAGNHDAVWSGNRQAHKHQPRWLAAGFASIQSFARRRIDGRAVMLSHLPYEGDHGREDRYPEFRLRDAGHPLLCGHVHDAWVFSGRQFNVGVDVHGMRPVHLDVVRLWLSRLPE